MSQEANKKSKKWLWLIIAIVAVLAVVGIVLGIVLSGPAEEGPSDDASNGPKGGRADIYWNIDKDMYTDPTTGMSAREPGADGKYHITFAHDGEQVEYIFTDKRLVNYIDTVDAVGLVFDDKGNVVDAVDVTTIAKEMAKAFYVVKVEGSNITLNGSATLDGLTKQIACTDLTKVMNFACARENKGELIQPEDVRPLDMVIVYGNDLDEATHFAVMTSPVESAIYWRQAQFYNYGERMTTREPNEDGTYTVPMFCNGELLDLKFRNVEDVNTVDKVTSDICHIGLIFDEDGYVVGTQPSQNGIRGRIACEQFDVTEVNGNTFTATKRVGAANLIGNTYTGTLPEGAPVHDASAYFDESQRGKDVGSLQLGDRITVWEDTLGNIVEIYIYIRVVPGPIYYKVDTLGANRQPDENGWYTFEHFAEGSVKTLKTKNELMARWLEQNAFVGLKLKGNVIEDAWTYGRVVAHGYVDYGRYWYKVSSVAGMVVTLTSGDGATMLSKIASPECKVYNLSGIGKYGEETTFQVGDQGVFISDHTGQMVYAVITERTVAGTAVYYNLNRRYDGANKCTARTPDDNGYYVFEMAHNGKQVTIKTKSKAVASKIDKIDNCIIALKPNSKGIVTDAYRGVAATGGRVQCGGQWQYECVLEDGNIQLQRADLPESKYIVKPADDMKVYNVSNVGFNKFRGEADKLEVGDHVLILTDANDKTVIAYIIKQTFKDVTKFCEHCNKKVKFVPWTGTNFSLLEEASGHYYVPANGAGCSTSILGDVPKEKGDKIIIDLNGKTMEFAEGQRNFIIYNEVKVSIIDSVGGGKMINPFFNCGGFGGKMDIYGGTFELPAQHQVITAGGVLNISGSHGTTVNFYGGKFISKDPKIEAVAIKNSTVNIHSGFVCDSALTIGTGAEVNMSGTVKIAQLKIDKGILLDFTKLGSKSKIGVVARGVFTTHMSASELSKVKKLVSCPVKGGSIVVEGDQLACYGTEPDYTQVYEQSLKMDFSNTEKLPTTCPFCDRGAVWEPLPEPDKEGKWYPDVVLGGGKHYYLDKNRSIEGVYMLDGGDVCLHLNGKTITSTGREIFTIFYGKTLNIMGKGTVKGSGSIGNNQIASVISNNGDLNLCGGTYVATSKGDAPIFANRGNNEDNNINIYDGTINTTGIAIKVRSKNLLVAGGTVNGRILAENTKYTNPDRTEYADVVIRGGTVEKLISTDANLDIQGGKIAGITIATAGNGTLKLSGAPKIEELKFLVDAKVDATKLTAGAEIGINKVGVFTTNFASEDAAEAAKGYFTAVQSAAEIKRDGSALTCVGGAAPAPDEPTPEPKPEYNKTEVQKIIDAADAMTFPADGSDKKAKCPYCNKTVTWKGIKDASKGMMSGHYYLANDISVSNSEGALFFGQWTQDGVTQDVCLHLNGKQLINAKSAGLSAIRVWTNYRLNILGDGYVEASGAGWGVLDVAPAGAVVNVYGGTYHSSSNYRTVAAKKGTLNIYNANVENGFVWVTDASAVSKVNIFDGTYNEIRMDAADDKVTVLGGTIKKLTATSAVYVYGGKIEKLVGNAGNSIISVEGKPEIGELDMTATNIKLTVGKLATGADITVKANAGVFTKNFASEADAAAAKAFFTGVSGTVEADGKALTYVIEEVTAKTPAQIVEFAKTMTFPTDGSDKRAECPACGEIVVWKALTATSDNTAGGHYYLTDSTTFANQWGINVNCGTSQTVCLHLNGKTLAAGGDGAQQYSAVRVWGGNLNVMGNGTLSSAATNWGALDIHATNAGTVNIYGGTYISTGGNRRALVCKSGNINIYDAKIETGLLQLTKQSDTAYPTAKIFGGTYAEVLADTTPGSLSVQGGTIAKLKIKANPAKVEVVGAPTITTLDMSEATTKLTVGTLTSGASIGVSATGVFTTDFATEEAATAAKAYFTAISGELKVEGKALAIGTGSGSGGTEPPTPGPGTNPDPNEPVVLTPAQIVAAGKAMTFPTNQTSKTATCPKCGVEVTWVAMTEEMINTSTTRQYHGHYYLAEDIDFETQAALAINANGKLCLHLNGKSFSSPAAGGWNATIRGNTELNIFDNGNGSINGNASAAIWANCPTNIYGGTYTATNAHAVFELRGADGEAINFYDGKITSGDVRMNGDNAAFNMYGGEFSGTGKIKGNAVKTGMKVSVHEGAKITATGGITTYYINLEITGGEINKVVTGADTQSFKLSGEPKITELDMSVVDDSGLIQVGTLGTNASIGVKANGVFTTEFADEATAKAAKTYFTAVDTAKGITNDGKALTCIDASLIPPEVLTPAQIIEAANAMTFPTDKTSKSAYCPVCGEYATWTALSQPDAAHIVMTSGHYYLAESISLTNTNGEAFGYYITSGVEVCLNRNGKDIVSYGNHTQGEKCYSSIRVNGGSLNLMGEGLVSGSAYNWGALDASGTVNVYGGNFFNNTGNRRAIAVKNGTVNIYGATIEKGWIYATGGVVNVESGTYEGVWTNNDNATANVNGGTLMNVNHPSDTMAGNLNVNGGTITTMTVKDTAGTTTISGAPVITTLDMSAAGDKKLTVGQLTEGASIGVNAADGTFTTAFADKAAAIAAKAFFTSAVEGRIVAAEGTALVIKEATLMDLSQQIVITANAMTFEAGNIPTTCPKCGENVTWQKLNQDNFTEGARTGHWYLSSDITVEDTTRNPALISASGTLCLHLNGHSVSVTSAGFDGRCLYASTGNTLNLYGTGSINGQGPATAMWVWGGTANIYGGDFNAANSTACIEMRANGTLNFFGGSQSTGKIRHAAANTVLNVYGGSISNFSASGTGNIATAKTNIYGGTVTTAAAYGSALTVTGGNITTLNSCAPTSTGGITISGNPKITTLTLRSDFLMPTFGAFTEGASIGLGTYTGIISTAYATPAEAQAVADTFPVTPGYGVTVNASKELVYGTKTYTAAEIVELSAKQTFGTTETEAYCYACNKMVTWKPIAASDKVHQGNAIVNAGHYFIANDIIDDSGADILNFNNYSGQKAYCLHLNGKTLECTTTSGSAIKVWTAQNTLNIMGNGQVKNKAGLWGALHIQGATTVNVYGGTYSCNSNDQDRAIHVAKEGAIVNIYDATVLETVTGTPASGKLHTSAGTINVFGGTYPYGYVSADAGILNIKGGTFNVVNAVAGTVDVTAGTITRLMQTAAALTISGSPVIGNLDMSTATVKATVGTLTTGASIGVTAEGEFTNDIADVSAAKAFFSAVASGKKIDISGQKLTCVDAA